jgi:MOSC domain-containing protein YiiM
VTVAPGVGDGREVCEQCRFDSAAYGHEDVRGTLGVIEPWWRLLVAPMAEPSLRARPAPQTWSAIEYCAHSELVVGLHAAGLELLAGGDDVRLPPFADDDVANAAPVTEGSTIAATIAALARNAEQLRVRYLEAHRRRLTNTLTVADDQPRRAGWLARHAIHDTLHHLQDVGRGFVALGVGTPHHVGTVARVHAGPGGVPKPAVDAALVGYRGIAGDVQAERRHHGRVWQALCLYSTEAIARLRAEGHPIEPGAAGENLTLTGVDFAVLRPGTRMRIGEVLCELSVPATPCSKVGALFSDGDFMRIHHERDAAATRWYARVLEDGTLRAGAEVEVEPAS